MCNLYSITTNQAAIAALFRVANGYVGNLAPMPGVFPDYPAPVVCNTDAGRELTMMRWGMPAAAEIAVATGHKYPHHDFTALAALAQAGGPLSRAVQLVCRVCAGAEPRDQEKGCRLVRSQ